MKPAGFTIRPVTLTQRGHVYERFELSGYDTDGKRVRSRFETKEEAEGEKQRLEIKAANAAGAPIRVLPTRLTDPQMVEAEAVFARLNGRSLTGVVDWYLANYRPPCVDKPLAEAKDEFLAHRKPDVELVHWNDMRRRLKVFADAFPSRLVGTLTTEEISTYLNGQGWGNKTVNNTRGILSAFFDYCVADARRWHTANPVSAIPQKKVTRGLPQIETAAKIAELFEFLEKYTGGERKPKKPGFLVPYFALATFGGMRPAVPNGEIWKLAHSPNLTRLLNFKTGVIHVTPEIAKTDDIRAVKIRANLRAWLERYPVSEHPIVMPNMQAMVTEVRKKYGLSDDVLRHTYITAHVAKFKSIGEAAIEAGNSESIIRAHYLNVMSEEEAAAFWAIVPKAPAVGKAAKAA